MLIREVSPRHFAAELIDMQMECLPNDDPLIPTKKGRWWIAFDDSSKEAGFACSMHCTGVENSSYLARVGVLKKYRGKGLQRRFISVREQAARKDGHSWMLSDCIYDNYASANSLMDCGYRLYEPNYKWALKESIYWRKKL